MWIEVFHHRVKCPKKTIRPMLTYSDEINRANISKVFPIAKSGGAGGDIFIHFVRLPFIFEEDETQVKNNLTTVIKSILGVDNL